MDRQITTISTAPSQTITRGQLEAIKAGIRAAATANPASMEHAARCRELVAALCGQFGLRRLADLPEGAFPQAMKEVAAMAVPQRRHGPAEARLKDAKERLSDALADLLRARRGIAAFRYEVEASLLVPLKGALDVAGTGTLEAVVQDGVGYLLTMPMLQMEHDLERMHEWLNVLRTRLPSIGRALDERRDGDSGLPGVASLGVG